MWKWLSEFKGGKWVSTFWKGVGWWGAYNATAIKGPPVMNSWVGPVQVLYITGTVTSRASGQCDSLTPWPWHILSPVQALSYDTVWSYHVIVNDELYSRDKMPASWHPWTIVASWSNDVIVGAYVIAVKWDVTSEYCGWIGRLTRVHMGLAHQYQNIWAESLCWMDREQVYALSISIK